MTVMEFSAEEKYWAQFQIQHGQVEIYFQGAGGVDGKLLKGNIRGKENSC